MSRGFVGDTRPRVFCTSCGRSIAVTINDRTEQMYVRSHVSSPRERCSGSGRTLPASYPTHLRPREEQR